MAGERWTQLKEMLLGLDIRQLQAAGQDWEEFASALVDVEYGFQRSGRGLSSSGLVAAVRDPLWVTVQQMQRVLTNGSGALGRIGGSNHSQSGPAQILRNLADALHALREGVLKDDAEFPTAVPDPVRLGDPFPYLLLDIRREQFDQLAADYEVRLVDRLLRAVNALEDVELPEPAGLPRADPSADLGALGVPAGPR